MFLSCDDAQTHFIFSGLYLPSFSLCFVKCKQVPSHILYFLSPIGCYRSDCPLPSPPCVLLLLVHGSPWGLDRWKAPQRPFHPPVPAHIQSLCRSMVERTQDQESIGEDWGGASLTAFGDNIIRDKLPSVLVSFNVSCGWNMWGEIIIRYSLFVWFLQSRYKANVNLERIDVWGNSAIPAILYVYCGNYKWSILFLYKQHCIFYPWMLPSLISVRHSPHQYPFFLRSIE